MVGALKYIFKHLKVHELLVASQVCQAWNLIAMQEALVSYVFYRFNILIL